MINDNRNLEIDRLRGIAIFMTMYIHYSRVFFPWNINPVYVHNNSIANLFSYCWTGVDLFFVISGYIISKTLISQINLYKADINQLALTIRWFYLKRIYRLYPAKWVVFLLVLLCSVFFNHAGYFSSVESLIEVGVSIFLSIFNYYFVAGLYHEFSLQPYWSLAVEEQFYFIVPLFFIFIRNNKHRVITILCLLLIITFYIRPHTIHGNFLNIFLTQTRCDGLLYGILLYFLTEQTWFKLVASFQLSKIIKYLILLTLTISLMVIPALGLTYEVIIPFACIISFILVLLASLQNNIIVFPQPIQFILDYLGSRSYSLYLIHFPMFTVTQEIFYRLSLSYGFKLNNSMSLYYTITAALLIFISGEILYQLVENPFISKYKQKNRNYRKKILIQTT